MSHTPGPWVFGGKNSWEIWSNAKGESHGYAVAYLKPKLDNRPIQDEAEREANARLIAAAPELLEALKGIPDHILNCGHAYPHTAACFCCVVKAALAKAEGGV